MGALSTSDYTLHATAQAKHQVEGRLLLDVVVRQRAAVLQLLAGEDQALLVGRDALLVLNLLLHAVDRVRGLHIEGDRLTREGLDENLHAAAEAKHKVERRLLLDVVVRQRAAVLQLLAREDQTLLVGRDALLVLDLLLHAVDRVRGLHIQGDRLARKGLDEDLHAAAEAKNQVERRLLLDVVVRQRAAVLQLLAGEDQTLLVGRDALLVLDLLLHAVDRVRGLHIEGDRLTREGLDEDLHAAAKAKNQVEGRLLLDVVVRQRAAVLQLLAGEDQALLVGRDALLVLDLLLHAVDRVRGLHIESDRLTREGLDEDLHAAAKPKHQVQSRLLRGGKSQGGIGEPQFPYREKNSYTVATKNSARKLTNHQKLMSQRSINWQIMWRNVPAQANKQIKRFPMDVEPVNNVTTKIVATSTSRFQ